MALIGIALIGWLGLQRRWLEMGLAAFTLFIPLATGLDAIPRYRRNDRTGEAIKDNLRDHVLDALRYLVCECIPADKPQARAL